MIILGLTGSIGMGKSTTGEFFKQENIPVYNADETVHALYREEPALSLIEAAFKGTVIDNCVDRARLSAYVVGNPDNMKKLEAIVHPLVHEKEQQFLKIQREKGAKIAVLDIPLLFETGGEARVDYSAVVSAPYEVQRARVLARPDMNEEKFANILKRQMPDEEKRQKADFVINSGDGLEAARQDVQSVIKQLYAYAADK